MDVDSYPNPSKLNKNIESGDNLNQKEAISQNPVNTLRGGDLRDYAWKLLVIWHAVNSQAPVEGFTPKLLQGDPNIPNMVKPANQKPGVGANKQPRQGPSLGPRPKEPSPRIASKVVNRSSKRFKTEIKFDMDKEYREFQKAMDPRTQCSRERFEQLCTNPQTGKVDEKSIIETKSVLRAEAQGMVQKAVRPKNIEVDLDFKISGPDPYTHVDIKTPIDFATLEAKGIDITGFPSLDQVAYKMGRDIPDQKVRFCKGVKGSDSPDSVLHIVNFENCPPDQIESMRDQVLKGTKEVSGSVDGIQFLNDK